MADDEIEFHAEKGKVQGAQFGGAKEYDIAYVVLPGDVANPADDGETECGSKRDGFDAKSLLFQFRAIVILAG